MKKIFTYFKNFWNKGKLSKFIIVVVCLFIVFGIKSLISNVSESIKKSEEHSQEYIWPDSNLSKMLPQPETKTGMIEFDREDLFKLVLYDSSKEEFNDYVSKCKEKGFTVDYDTYESDISVTYSACNAANKDYKLTVEFYKEDNYYDKNSMEIGLQKIEKETKENNSNNSNSTTGNNNAKKETATNNKIDPKFKKAMDSYEDFFDEYISFMEKYNKNTSNASLLKDYTKYMKKYTDTMDKLKKMKTDDLNDAELKYYTDVQLRITKKLSDAAI